MFFCPVHVFYRYRKTCHFQCLSRISKLGFLLFVFCFPWLLIIPCWSSELLSISYLGKCHLLCTFRPIAQLPHLPQSRGGASQQLPLGQREKEHGSLCPCLCGLGSQRKMQMPSSKKEQRRRLGSKWRVCYKEETRPETGWMVWTKSWDRALMPALTCTASQDQVCSSSGAKGLVLSSRRKRIKGSLYSLRMMPLIAALPIMVGSYPYNHLKIMVLFENGGHSVKCSQRSFFIY